MVTGAFTMGDAGGRRQLLPILQQRGLRAPRCQQILLFLFQLPFVHSLIVACFADAFPEAITISKSCRGRGRVSLWKLEEQMVALSF